MIELKALNLHWLENFDELEYDLCVHSPVWLKIGETIISNEEKGDWTVSASAFHLLNTLLNTHDGKALPQLIPCCGFIMELNEGKDYIIVDCPNGINWSITHSKKKIIHLLWNGKIIETLFDDWKKAVCYFSDEVINFYKISNPRKFKTKQIEESFNAFMNDWINLRKSL